MPKAKLRHDCESSSITLNRRCFSVPDQILIKILLSGYCVARFFSDLSYCCMSVIFSLVIVLHVISDLSYYCMSVILSLGTG